MGHRWMFNWNSLSFCADASLFSAGQERFRALRTPFYRGSDICLLTYAVNDQKSFAELKQWREEFLKYADVDAEYFPFIVVGNKVSGDVYYFYVLYQFALAEEKKIDKFVWPMNHSFG